MRKCAQKRSAVSLISPQSSYGATVKHAQTFNHRAYNTKRAHVEDEFRKLGNLARIYDGGEPIDINLTISLYF